MDGDSQCRVFFRFIHIGRSKQTSSHTRKLVGKGYLRGLRGYACAHNSSPFPSVLGRRRQPQPVGMSQLSAAQPCLRWGIWAYCWKTGGGPLTRRHFSRTFTSTRLAILMKGMPLVMPQSFRSKAMVPSRLPVGVPLLSLVRVSVSVLVTRRMVKLPSMSKVFGPV